MKFGDLIRKHRMGLEMNLRRFCQEFGHDPSNWSKLERGLLPPPSDAETLERIANQLGIKADSPEWLEFFDSAYLSKGEIPPYVRQDEDVMEKLPLFFRTVSGNKPTEHELEQLAQLLKRNS